MKRLLNNFSYFQVFKKICDTQTLIRWSIYESVTFINGMSCFLI